MMDITELMNYLDENKCDLSSSTYKTIADSLMYIRNSSIRYRVTYTQLNVSAHFDHEDETCYLQGTNEVRTTILEPYITHQTSSCLIAWNTLRIGKIPVSVDGEPIWSVGLMI
jgi:hypothetical protein